MVFRRFDLDYTSNDEPYEPKLLGPHPLGAGQYGVGPKDMGKIPRLGDAPSIDVIRHRPDLR